MQLDPWHNKDDLADKCNRISVLSNLPPYSTQEEGSGLSEQGHGLIFTDFHCRTLPKGTSAKQ